MDSPEQFAVNLRPPKCRTKYGTGTEWKRAQAFSQRNEFQDFLQQPYQRDGNPQAQDIKAIIGPYFTIKNLRSMERDLRRWGHFHLGRQALREEWSIVFYFHSHLETIRQHWNSREFTIQKESANSPDQRPNANPTAAYPDDCPFDGFLDEWNPYTGYC
jgi:hypothetical protein